jgi:membrane protease YdiL (CAAX protease family)
MSLHLSIPAKTRSIWHPLIRLALVGTGLFAIYVGAQLGKGFLGERVPEPLRTDLRVTFDLVVAALLLAGYGLAVRVFERRRANELLFRKLPALPIGLGVGVLLFCCVELLGLGVGISRPLGYQDPGDLVPQFSDAVLAAVGEEIVFRGVIFRLLDEAFGTPAALIASSAVFGLVHAFNPGATLVGVIAIALEAGVLLGLAYVLARSLWLPIGIHLGWNFTEGGIFGSAVSGGVSHGAFPMTLQGPVLLTGGAFGLEASVLSVLVCLMASGVIGWLAYRRGLFRRPSVR